MDGVQLSIFISRLQAVCDEMGLVLQRTAFSPNIKDRLDYSCAIFNPQGELCAQAAHIPVHLGSMAYAMQDLVSQQAWQAGDVLVLNDPFLGGTHLPDVTLISPVFVSDQLVAFVANRAHHGDIGAKVPGSMPLSQSIEDEGLLISPQLLFCAGVRNEQLWQQLSQLGDKGKEGGDFAAQISANKVALKRLQALVIELNKDAPVAYFANALAAINEYGQRLAQAEYQNLADGEYEFVDYLDNDGYGAEPIKIALRLTISKGLINADFSGSAAQVRGNINCPLSVAAAAVFYVFRCLLPAYTPACAGVFKAISLSAPKGSILNAQYPAAVVAGNVETSSRVVDVVMGALAQACPQRIPAASHGSMNNLAMGNFSSGWHYYETIGGGAGAANGAVGANGIQTHMTNTLNTPIESLEVHYPLRVLRYGLRVQSHGEGLFCGGEGIERELQILDDAELTLLTERRTLPPWGSHGGQPGQLGANFVNGEAVAGKCYLQLSKGDTVLIQTPGGGGWGLADKSV